MTNRPARGMLFPLRVETAAAAGLRAGVVPGFGVKSKLFLCLEFLGVSVKHRPNYPVRGVSTTDRKRPFSFKAGSRAMSVVNSTAASKAAVNFNGGEASPGTITLPASQVAPEIENAGQNTRENGNPDILPDRMAVARAKRAEFRAGPAQRANFKGKSPDGYNHPTGTLSQAYQRSALEENALKSIVAERLKAGRAKQAALTSRAGRGMLSPLHPTMQPPNFHGHQAGALNENYFLPVEGIFWLDVKPAARGGELARCLSAPTVKPFLFPSNGREA